MKILADENIPFVKELFSDIGEIITCEGRKITADKLSDIDLLLVRSVTKVGKELLKNSPVRFVGTATIGIDHLDTVWLKQEGIHYANAPGCNSIAVAEYVLSALLVVAEKFDVDLRSSKVGIIGAGNVGTTVAHRLSIMGIPHGIYDPPLQSNGDPRPMLTEEQLSECEFISLHVPLTTAAESQWPTIDMVTQHFFKKMNKLKYLINTSRGDVVDTESLKDWLDLQVDGIHCHQAIIDVWQNEPSIDCDLLRRCFLASPHIAGHTREGKIRGTLMLFHALCEALMIEDTLDDDSMLNRDLPKDIIHLTPELTFMQALGSAIWRVYDIRDDDKALRTGLINGMPKHFDQLRKGYKVRREFSAHRLELVSLPEDSRRTLTELGFVISTSQESLS